MSDLLERNKALNHCIMTRENFVVGARSLILYCAKTRRLAWNLNQKDNQKARTKFPGRACRLILSVMRLSSLASGRIAVKFFSLTFFSILINSELKFATARFIPGF